MPFPSTTLSSTQYDLLRGTASVNPRYRCRVYTSVCPNDVVVACRVNGAPTGSSFISFSYDGVTDGAIANVKVRQTILISRTNDKRAAYFTGRVKALPTGSTSGTIYINECSAAIADNDYVWVINDYRVWPVLGRDDAGVNKKDYNVTYVGDPPLVTGLQTIYAGWVDSTSGKLRIAFSVSAVASVSGATISSYLFSFEGVTAVISGALASSAVTIDFDPSAGVWGHLVVTDSGGRTLTRDFLIFPHNATYLPLTGADSISVSGELSQGWSGQMTAFAGADSILDNSLVCVWVDEKYNSTSGSLLSGTNDKRNVAFVGRIRTESNKSQVDPQSGVLADTVFQLEGVGQQLNRLHGALIAEILDASANEFDEIVNLTIWRGIVHVLAFHSTFLNLHDLAFDSTADTYLCQGLRTQGSNLLDVINDLAQSINAAIEFAPDGACRIVRDPRYLGTSARNSLPTLANWTEADYINSTLDIDNVYRVGKVTGDGGMFFNLGSINQVYPLLSIAPGVAQDYPEASSILPRQVLTANTAASVAQTELNERVGRHFAVENTQTALSIEHLDGYRWLIPSRGYWFTWTIASNANAHGRAYTTAQRWLLNSISVNFDTLTSTCSAQADYILDIDETTLGAAGDSVVYPDPGNTVYPDLPPLPPIDPYPGIPDDGGYTEEPPIDSDPINPALPPRNGSTVIIGDDDNVWLTTNFLATTPIWRDITPVQGSHYLQALLDPFPNGRRAWVLANDGTDSFVYYTADVFEAYPTWSTGATVDGIYTVLRTTDVSGGIMLYSPDAVAGAWTQSFDFTVSNGGWTARQTNEASYTAATGWQNGSAASGEQCYIRFTLLHSATFTSASFTFTTDASPAGFQGCAIAYDGTPGTDLVRNDALAQSPGGTLSFSGSQLISNTIDLDVNVNTTLPHNITISSASFAGTGGNPFGGASSGNAGVTYSTNNGATWNTAQPIGGAAISVGGFDTVRVGDVSIGGGNAQGYKATTKGGAYTSLGSDGATSGSQPVLLELPWSQWGSTALDNWSTSTPDYLLGSAALVSSHCLWRVDGGGGRTGITPTGATAMISPNCASTYLGTKAAVIASVSGTRHLFTSTNIGSSDTWTDRGASGASSDYIRPLRLSQTLKQLFYVSGAVAKFSADYGATIVTKQTPSTGTLLWIEPYG